MTQLQRHEFYMTARQDKRSATSSTLTEVPSQPSDFAQMIAIGGVRKTQMSLSPMLAEITAGSNANSGLLQERERERVTVVGVPSAAGIEIERATRTDRQLETQRGQIRQQLIAASHEFASPFFQNSKRLGLESRERGILGRRRGSEEQILREPVERRHVFRGRHQPAQTPTRHTEKFRKAVHNEQTVGHFERGGARGAVVNQALINLISDEAAAAAFDSNCNALEFGGIDQRAG